MELLPPDDPWASYARTIVVVLRTVATNLVIEAAPASEFGPWPWLTDRPVWILTGWDPGNVRPGEDVNRSRQAALEKELRAGDADEMWHAVGVDPVSGHREEGVAVSGVDLGAVLALGARYGQDAIFEWTPEEWAIVACGGGRRETFGWSVTGD